MTVLDDKRYALEKERIGKFLTKWQGPMGLRFPRLNVTFDRSYHPKGLGGECDMSRWQYHEFDLTFYVPELMDLSDEDVERTVVHELVHCLLAPISVNMREVDINSDYYRQIMEFSTEAVAKSLLWCREEGADDYKAELKAKAKVSNKSKEKSTNE